MPSDRMADEPHFQRAVRKVYTDSGSSIDSDGGWGTEMFEWPAGRGSKDPKCDFDEINLDAVTSRRARSLTHPEYLEYPEYFWVRRLVRLYT